MRVQRLLLISLILFGCKDKIVDECETDDTGINQPVTFSWIQQNVFTPRCATAGCHGTQNPAENLNLSQGQSYTNLVLVESSQVTDLMRIQSNNSKDSYLVIKLEGGDSRMQGSAMPPGGSSLSQAVIDSIKAWIDRGALED